MKPLKPKYKVGTLFSCVPRAIPSNRFTFAMILKRQVMEVKGTDWSFGPQWYYDLILFNEETHRIVETDLDEFVKTGIMQIISEGPDEIQETTKEQNKRNPPWHRDWKD
jgi:hypothetical protein